MGVTHSDTESHTDRHTSLASTTQRSSPASTDIVRILESESETLTGAVAAGSVSLADLDLFVRNVDRGEIDGKHGLDAVIRIVRSLLGDDTPAWEEMEPAGRPVGA